MVINEVGTLIRKGMSTEDIQEKIRDFPSEVTTEYLESLGYEHLEAIKYKCELRHNDILRKEHKKKKERELLKKDGSFIISENADPKNIIVDTCAFSSQKSINIIEKSTNVTVLYQIIKEMEKVALKKHDKENGFLLYNIRHYVFKMLLDKPKYHLIKYKNDNSYVDDILIEYLETLKEKQRPTLLTADKMLSLKAKCLGIEFILVAESLGKKTDDEGSKEKYTNMFGVKVSYYDKKVRIERIDKNANAYVIVGERYEEIENEKEMQSTDLDYVVILKKDKKNKRVRVAKLKISKDKINNEQKECYVINEIYKLDIHPELQEIIKNLLIKK